MSLEHGRDVAAVQPPRELAVAENRLLVVRHKLAEMSLYDVQPNGLRRPRMPDGIMGEVAGQFAQEVGEGGVIDGLLETAMDAHPEYSDHSWVQQLVRQPQSFWLRTGRLTVDNLRNITPFLRTLESSRRERELVLKQFDWGQQTNISDRAAADQIAELLEYGTDGEPLKLIDIGPSRMYGDMKKLYRGTDPDACFHDIDVIARDPVTGMPVMEDRNHYALPDLSDRINRLLQNSRLPIASIVAIDLQDMQVGQNDMEAIEHRWWNLASFHGRELAYDKKRLREALLWEALYPTFQSLHFHQDDVANLNARQLVTMFPEALPFDAANFSVVGYQMKDDGFEQAVANLLPLMAENGRIFVTDVVEIAPDGRLHFLDRFKDWTWKTMMLDLADITKGWQELAVWETSRMGKMMLGRDFGNLALACAKILDPSSADN